MNLTLIIVILFTAYMIGRGYRKGMTKEISGLIALVVAFVVMALVIMLTSSYQLGEVTNTVYSVILLALLGIVYGVVRLVLNSIKLISKLPVLHFLDKFLGLVVGLGKAILFIWIFFLFCENNYLGTITEYVRTDIANSTILTLLYQYNFFIG